MMFVCFSLQIQIAQIIVQIIFAFFYFFLISGNVFFHFFYTIIQNNYLDNLVSNHGKQANVPATAAAVTTRLNFSCVIWIAPLFS